MSRCAHVCGVVLVVFALVCVLSVAWAEPFAAQGSQTAHGGITAQLDCAACHSPAGWRTLVAGPPGAGFNHDRTGFPLSGRHRQAACTQCHMSGRTITRACAGCHQDVHQRRLSQACGECHDASSWLRTAAIERHRLTRLPLSGMHSLLGCNDCHLRSAERTFAPVPADCFACHADDYRRTDIHPLHTGSADGRLPGLDRDCAVCHRANGWVPAFPPVAALPVALAPETPQAHELRFPIASGVHRGAACGDCHTHDDGRGPLRCIGCHAHDAQQLRAQHGGVPPGMDGSACLGCHPGGAAR